MVDLGQKLSQLRQKYGYSQAQIAEKLGTAQSNISYWESQADGAPYRELIKILDIYGLTMKDFWEVAKLSIDEMKLLELFRGISDSQRSLILKILGELKK